MPEGRDPAQLRDVDESQGRVDDDAAEGCGGEGGQDGAQPEQRRNDHDDRHERVELRARTHGVGEGGQVSTKYG